MDWVRVGITVRALRIRTNATQVEIAVRAHVPRDVVSSIERGRVGEVRLAELDRVVGALGASFDGRIRWRGEQLDRLLDEAHALTVAAVVERLAGLGWETAIEVSFSIWGERGSIDVLAWHPPTRTVLVIEVKSVIADLQSLLYGLDRKTRLALEIAAKRGWHATTVARLVVVAESPTSRGRVRRHAPILDAALPVRGRELRAWLRRPSGPVSGLLFLSNSAPGRATGPIWRRERARRSSTPRSSTQDRASGRPSELDNDSAAPDGVDRPSLDECFHIRKCTSRGAARATIMPGDRSTARIGGGGAAAGERISATGTPPGSIDRLRALGYAPAALSPRGDGRSVSAAAPPDTDGDET